MDARAIADKGQDCWNARDEEGFIALYSEKAEIVAPGFTGKGPEGLREFWALWNGAFPDNHISNRTEVAEGATAAQISTFQGTHTGPLMTADGRTIPPTGRHVVVPYVLFLTVRGGRAVRAEFMFDQLDLLGQIGLLPA
jgi:predicted ester cyclase